MPGRSRASASGEKPRRGQRARAIRLGEHVGPARERLQRRDAFRAPQVDVRRQLADAGIELDHAGVGQVRGAYLEHVGAVLGEAAGAGGARQHAREVQHAHPRQRPGRRGERLGRRVADALDLEQRLSRDCFGVRMARPLLPAAHESGTAAGGMDRLLERLALPCCARFLGIRPVGPGIENPQGGVTVVREVAVDADPAIRDRVEAAQRIPGRRRWFAVDAKVVRAAQRDRRAAKVDADALGPAAAQLPDPATARPRAASAAAPAVPMR